MHVPETGEERLAAAVDDLRAQRRSASGTDGDDAVAVDQHVAVRIEPRGLRVEHAHVVDQELPLGPMRKPPGAIQRQLGFHLLLRFFQRRERGFFANADEREPVAAAMDREQPALRIQPEVVGRQVQPGQ